MAKYAAEREITSKNVCRERNTLRCTTHFKINITVFETFEK